MFDILSLLAAAAAFAVGMALGWALAVSGRAAMAIREENARLRAELAPDMPTGVDAGRG